MLSKELLLMVLINYLLFCVLLWYVHRKILKFLYTQKVGYYCTQCKGFIRIGIKKKDHLFICNCQDVVRADITKRYKLTKERVKPVYIFED